MARVYVFADEAGNFDFSQRRGASTYFVLGTMTLSDTSLGARLLDLRRDLAWGGHGLETSFHAAKDRAEVKEAVFSLLEQSEFRFDAVVLDKSHAPSYLRADWERFYETAWTFHFGFVTPRILRQGDDLMVTAASIGTRRRRSAVRNAIDDVVRRTVAPQLGKHQVAFWSAESDPCIQAVDYATWAVQRKWERHDLTWYARIQSKVQVELRPWQR